MHYNGSAWSLVAAPTTKSLRSAYAIRADLAWIVGHDGTVMRWDGSQWTLQNVPTTRTLWEIWGPGKGHL